MREIKKIIIHCSASEWGDAAEIRRWHVEDNGWRDIGYHYVILNGRRKSRSKYDLNFDGTIEQGRAVEVAGAHCRGANKDSIGICLVGNSHFTSEQVFGVLPGLVKSLLHRFGLSPSDVYGHYEFSDKKTCPNLDMTEARNLFV